jgi:hypothetical protein
MNPYIRTVVPAIALKPISYLENPAMAPSLLVLDSVIAGKSMERAAPERGFEYHITASKDVTIVLGGG